MGNKSSSKLKDRRSQSMAWSFRFSNKKESATMLTTNPNIWPANRWPLRSTSMELSPNISIKAWLDILDLQTYGRTFSKFNKVIELMWYTETDIKKLGIRNSAHRARIVSSLVALRDKQQTNRPVLRDGSNMTPLNQRHSFAMGSTITEEAPIYESLNAFTQKQSKSLGDILKMETPTGDDTLALRKALEWELSLDSRDLRSHAWYHGPIPRQRADEIVTSEGDFLIRDCTSQPGNYVLSCKSTKGPVLHFVINKILIQPETVYERVQYQFEDDAYDTVADLITFYVGSGKAISAASGARIQFPCNRIYPLSFYASKYGNQNQRGTSPLNSPSLASAGIRFIPYNQQGNYNSYRSPMSSPPRTKRDTPPRLPSKKQRSSLTPIQTEAIANRLPQDKYNSVDDIPPNATSNDTKKLISSEKCNSADGMIQNITKSGNNIMTRSAEEKPTSADGIIHHSNNSSLSLSSAGGVGGSDSYNRFSSHSLQRTLSNANSPIQKLMHSSRPSSLSRDYSDSSLSPCPERRQSGEDEENEAPSPPPKPNRISHSNAKDFPSDNAPLNRVVSYHTSGSDSGNGSGDSAQSSAAGDPLDIIQNRGVIIKNPRFIPNSASSATLKSVPDIDYHAAEDALLAMNITPIVHVSKYDLENFHTLLLPTVENKPLDNEALNTFRMMLSETGPRVLANHLTRVDIKLILGDLSNSEIDPLDLNGIELLTVSHGDQFRRDLIERTECIKLLVAVTILTCSNDIERAETLNKWIQIAIDTKTALGNLFGFCAIMLGLCMPQIQKLEPTWHTLRQKYTDSAFNFEAKLRPTLKNMNDCSNPQAPNTTVPHLLPYVLLRDRGIEDILGLSEPQSTLISSCILPWEKSAVDFGLSIMFSHLDSVRQFSKNISLYQRNAQTVLNDSSCRIDEMLEDAFRTEFHIKFLWGSKGAHSSSIERHSKMEQILSLMADKFCNPDYQQQISSAI